MTEVLVFILIYRDDDIDPMPDFSPGLFREEKVNVVPKKWRNMEKGALDSPAATNLVKRLIQEKGFILIPLQKTLLEETLTAWFYKRKTGSYFIWFAGEKAGGAASKIGGLLTCFERILTGVWGCVTSAC